MIALAAVMAFTHMHITTLIAVHKEDAALVGRILPYLHNIMHSNTNYSKFRPQYNETPLNFIDDPSYCLKSDQLKIMHPDILLEDRYVVRDLEKNNLQREIIKKTMFDGV